jgi:hypothetical protein
MPSSVTHILVKCSHSYHCHVCIAGFTQVCLVDVNRYESHISAKRCSTYSLRKRKTVCSDGQIPWQKFNENSNCYINTHTRTYWSELLFSPICCLLRPRPVEAFCGALIHLYSNITMYYKNITTIN